MSDDDRSVIRNAVFTLFLRGAGLAVSLAVMPASLDFFQDADLLGLWFTILSVLNWIQNLDFGVGNAVRNHFTAAYARADYSEARHYLSSAAAVLLGVCLIAGAVFLPVWKWTDWEQVFFTGPGTDRDGMLSWTVLVVFMGILLQLLLKWIPCILWGMQYAWCVQLLSLGSSVLTLGALLLMTFRSRGDALLRMAWIHSLAGVLPLAAAGGWLVLFQKRKMLLPSVRCVRGKYVRRLLSLGGSFFAVQLAYMGIMNTNEYLITALTDSSQVVEYQACYKIFMTASTLASLAASPVWSAVTKAAAEENYLWVRTLLRRLTGLSVLAGVFLLILVPMVPFLLKMWLGAGAADVSAPAAVSFALWGSAVVFSTSLSGVANGLGRLGPQLVWFGLGAAMKFPLSWLLVKLTGSWYGVVLGSFAAMLPYCIAQPISLHRFFRRKGIL